MSHAISGQSTGRGSLVPHRAGALARLRSDDQAGAERTVVPLQVRQGEPAPSELLSERAARENREDEQGEGAEDGGVDLGGAPARGSGPY